MARCGDCNKFVSFEESEPEAEDPEVGAGAVTCSVRIVNACADCGAGLKEATLEMEAEFELPEGWREVEQECSVCGGKGTVAVKDEADPSATIDQDCETCDGSGKLAAHDEAAFEVEAAGDWERTQRSDGKDNTPSRYRRTFYGATGTATVTHPEFPDWSAEVTLADDVQAGGMDELG
jgi:hypothetical protein